VEHNALSVTFNKKGVFAMTFFFLNNESKSLILVADEGKSKVTRPCE
jgi:hypothetical protein